MLVGKVDFVVRLYDEFDGFKLTDGGVMFRCDGRQVTPLRKNEGYYVFHGLGATRVRLEISRPHYLPKFLDVDTSALAHSNPVLCVRLLRQYSWHFSDCDWLHGTGPPDSEVLAFSQEEQVRFQTQAEGKNRLAVLGYGAGGYVDRRFAPAVGSGDTFLLTQMLAPGVYLADREVAASGPWPVVRAHLSVSNGDGAYHIPVEAGQNIGDTVFFDKERRVWDCVSAPARK